MEQHKDTIAAALVIAVSTLSVIGLGLKVSSLKLPLPTKRQSLKIVHEEKGSGEVIDIVCVHGLGGHPYKTWTSTSPNGQTNWLTDILPADLRERNVRARVMTYDYQDESRLSTHFPAFLRHHSRRLAKQLSKKRGDKARNRPLIFIAHSLGGLIVRATLVYSSASEIDGSNRLKEIQSSTVGVLYFGTPYRDGQNLQWSQMLNRVMSINGSDSSPPDLDPLLWQDELFRLELDRYKSIEDKFRNVAFHETKTTTFLRDNARIVAVPKDLTIPVRKFELWESHALNRNHENLCKFESKTDVDYVTVLKALCTCLPSESYQYKSRAADIETLDQRIIAVDGNNEEEDIIPMVWRIQSFPSKAVLKNLPAAETRIAYLEEQVGAPKFLMKDFDTGLQTGLDLIDLYEDSNERDKSQALYKRLKKATKTRLDQVETRYGYRNPKSLRLTADLARVYAAAGQHQKSESLNRRLHVIIQDIYGEDSLQCAFILNQLAHNAHAQGEYDKAVSLLNRVRSIQTKRYSEGERHYETLRTIARLAIVLDQQGKYKEAQYLYSQVIESRKENLGPAHPETLKVMENLALSYRLQGRSTFPLAAELYRKVLDHRRKALGRYQPAELVNPDLKMMADESLCLYNETMTKLMEVVRQQRDFAKIRGLEDEWSQVKRANTADQGFSTLVTDKEIFNKSKDADHTGSNDEQPSRSRDNSQERDDAYRGSTRAFSRHQSSSNNTSVADEYQSPIYNRWNAEDSLQAAGTWSHVVEPNLQDVGDSRLLS